MYEDSIAYMQGFILVWLLSIGLFLKKSPKKQNTHINNYFNPGYALRAISM